MNDRACDSIPTASSWHRVGSAGVMTGGTRTQHWMLVVVEKISINLATMRQRASNIDERRSPERM